MRWACAAIITVLGAAAAEPPLKLGTNAGKEVAETQALLAAGKSAEAADKLRRLTTDAGDDLVSLDGRHYRPLSRAVQSLVLALPPTELQAWRGRVDPPALKLLELGKSIRDPRPLRELVFRYFVSSHAEEALLLLAELAAERGDHRTAEAYLRRLLPTTDVTADPSVPDPKTPAGTVYARIALNLIFQRHPGAAAAVAEVRAKFPTAAGRLAGRDGPFADTLEALVKEPPVTAVPPLPTGDWPTLGGDASRSGRPVAAVPRYWPSLPAWRADFPTADGTRRLPTLPQLGSTRSVALHPVTIGDTGYVSDGSRVFGFDLRTGATRYLYDLATEPDATVKPGGPGLPTEVDADFTLTSADGRLYARLGDTAIDPLPQVNGRNVSASFLVCFGPPADRQPGEAVFTARWKLKPPVAEGSAAAWEAAPVAADGNLYAAFVRESPGGLVAEVACYPALDTTPDRPLWVTPVADLRGFEGGQRHRGEPLTVAGGLVTYCTHTGSILALDAATGKVAWAYQYPRLAKPPTANRDINPPVAHAGRLFVAPTDADAIFCLDLATGQLLWQADGVQTDQFLGVAAGNLVTAVSAPQRGLHGYDIVNGSDRGGRGWRIQDDPRLGSWGRGLVTEDVALWPTKAGVFFVRPADGLSLAPRLPGPHGNLAFGNGVLLVGTPTGVMGYVADPGPMTLPDRAEIALRTGRRDEARAVWAGVLSDTTLSADNRARAAARLAGLEAPRPDALTEFLTRYPATATLDDAAVIPADGIPVSLRRHLSAHFGTAVETPRAPVGSVQPAAEDLPPALDPTATTTAVIAGPPTARPLRTPSGELATLGTGGDTPALLWAEPGRVTVTNMAGELLHSIVTRHTATTAIPAGPVTYLAGPDGVSAVDLAAGRVFWEFRVPDTDPLPPAGATWVPSRGGVTPHHDFGPFHLTPSHLVALWSDSHLVGVNRTTGMLDWVRPAGVSPTLALPLGDGPHYSPAFWCGDGLVVAHSTLGERLTIRAATGELLSRVPTTPAVWVTPPVPRPDGRVTVPGDLGRLYAVEPAADSGLGVLRGKWPWEPGSVASLTGEPTLVIAAGNGLLAAVPRNYGTELQLLKPDGRSLRPRGVVMPEWGIDLRRARRALRTTYLPAGGKLYALSDTNGTFAWPAADLAAATDWPRDAAWRVLPGRRSVLAYPDLARPVVPIEATARRLLRQAVSHPVAALVPAFLFAFADSALASRFPLVFLDPDTGKVLATRELAVIGPAVTVGMAGEFLAVAAAGRTYLLKSP